MKNRFTVPTKSITIVALLGLMLIPNTKLFAEIHPKYYAEMQAEAGEYIEIEVDRVRRGLSLYPRTTPLTIKATVLSVWRSETKLEVGDSITIKYDHLEPARNWVGPRPIPVLRRDGRYPAFLTWYKGKEAYIPAARGASFEPEITLE
jgi:hypothetical protein